MKRYRITRDPVMNLPQGVVVASDGEFVDAKDAMEMREMLIEVLGFLSLKGLEKTTVGRNIIAVLAKLEGPK